MPRTRTTPEALKTAHFDTIEYFAVQIAYDSNLQISLPATNFVYGYANRDASGQPVNPAGTRELIAWGDIPANLQTKLKDIFAAVLTDAESKGHIGAGTDSNDLP